MEANGVNKLWKQSLGFATRAVHGGHDPDQWNSGCVVPPIVSSTTFKRDSPTQEKGFRYGRTGNPTRQVLEENLANLDNGKYGLTFSSGVSATNCIASLLDHGDQLICQEDIFGGTISLLKKFFQRMGVEVIFADLIDPTILDTFITSKTKLIWCETPTNPLLRVLDIKEIAERLERHPGVLLAVDNTFATSYLQRPLDLGADIVMYSLTKYMNGHTDVVMGAAVTNREDLYERMKFLQQTQGAVPSPYDCYMVNRGLKTLAVRMRQHMKSSLEIAWWMSEHPIVERVLHPGLPSHPQHETFKRQCSGHSGMLTFCVRGGLDEAKKLLGALKVFTVAESLGGCESLAGMPILMSHSSLSREECLEMGLTDNMIRLSVGLEDTKDLIDDLEQALMVVAKI